MKKQMILSGLIAFATTLHAQWDNSTSQFTTTAPIVIGSGPAPIVDLEVNTYNPYHAWAGIAVSHLANQGSAALHLSVGNAGGSRWSLYALGNTNHVGSANNNDFSIYDNMSNASRVILKRTTGYMGINEPNPVCRLHVTENAAPYAGWFSAYGAYGGAGLTTGLVSQANGWNLSSSIANVGIDASANPGGQGYGQSMGIWGTGYNGATIYGGRFEGISNGFTTLNIGVFGGTNGVGTNCWAGYFSGNVYRSGTDNFTSDRKLKNDIRPLSNALDKLMQLKPSTYTFKTDEFKLMNLPKGPQMGLIAQDLEQVFPELVTDMSEVVTTDRQGNKTVIPAFKSVQYISLIPVLIGGMQEQQATIEAQQKTIAQQTQINNDLQKQLDEQKQLLDNLSQKVSGATGVNTNGGIEAGFSMSQNEPNPFTHETVVNYTLPQTVSNAFLAVYDLTGKQIASFPITQKGSASLTITSETLAAGIYLYSVVADGKVVDSKRMIVAAK